MPRARTAALTLVVVALAITAIAAWIVKAEANEDVVDATHSYLRHSAAAYSHGDTELKTVECTSESRKGRPAATWKCPDETSCCGLGECCPEGEQCCPSITRGTRCCARSDKCCRIHGCCSRGHRCTLSGHCVKNEDAVVEDGDVVVE